MKKVPYKKPALTYTEQLEKLKKRGLIIKNEQSFLDVLEKKSYYRLSGYWYPLLIDKEQHIFKPNADFDTAYKIYLFDKHLRQLVIKELEKIEIAVRAKMIYIFSHKDGPFWYTNPRNFKNTKVHEDTLVKIQEEFHRSDAQFIQAYKQKYSDSLPPSWSAFEIISFGSISRLYYEIKSGKSKRVVSEYFGLDDKTFASWLHGLVYVRNVCAHHARLWNRIMRIQPGKLISPKNTWLSNTSIPNNRTYYVLSMIVYLLNNLDESNSMVTDLKSLLIEYDNIDTRAMGFPSDWRKEFLWQ